jgi:hypothetical protein
MVNTSWKVSRIFETYRSPNKHGHNCPDHCLKISHKSIRFDIELFERASGSEGVRTSKPVDLCGRSPGFFSIDFSRIIVVDGTVTSFVRVMRVSPSDKSHGWDFSQREIG